MTVRISQQEIIDFHRLPQGRSADPVKAFIGNKLRRPRAVEGMNQCWTYCGFEISLAGFADRKA